MLSEQSIYEKLNDALSIRGFITATVALFDDGVERLINRVFRKTDFAVKSVVDSLLEQSGPLADLAIRLKVLCGLGVISHQVFSDILAFIQLKETLNNAENEYAFADPLIVAFVQQLQFQQDKSLLQFDPELGDKNSLLYQVKALRQEKLVRSCLMLIITDIYTQLQVESPL